MQTAECSKKKKDVRKGGKKTKTNKGSDGAR